MRRRTSLLGKLLHIGSWVRKHFYVVTWTVDFAMVQFFLVCFVTGVLMFPGFLDFFHVRARNFPFETVKFLHDWSGLGLGFGILFHLGLHWRSTLQFIRNKLLHIPAKGRKHKAPEEVPG